MANGNVNRPNSIEELLKQASLILKSNHRQERLAAFDMLEGVGDERAMPALVEGLYDESMAVRRAAGRALVAAGHEVAIAGLVEAFRQGDWAARDTAAELIEEIGAQPENEALRAVIEPVLIEALRDGPCDVRRSAEVLAAALKDKVEDVRYAAAVSLGQHEACSAVHALIDSLRDESREVRRAAIKSLGQIGHVAAVPGLVGMLWDADWNIRRIAADALNRIGPEGAQSVGNWSRNL